MSRAESCHIYDGVIQIDVTIYTRYEERKREMCVCVCVDVTIYTRYERVLSHITGL